MKPPRAWSYRIFALLTLLAFGVLLAPVFWIFATGLAGEDVALGEPIAAMLRDPRQWVMLRNSLAIAASVSAVSTLLGGSMAVFIERWRAWGVRGLYGALAAAFLMPPYVTAMAWVDLAGRGGWLATAPGAPLNPPPVFGLPGVIVTLTCAYYPVVTFAGIVALRRMDQRLEDAARIAVGPRRAFWGVSLPVAAPAMLSATLFVFLMSFLEFSVPSLLMVSVYPVAVYEDFATAYDVPAAVLHAVPLLIVGGAVWLFWLKYLRPRHAWLSGGRSEPRREALPGLHHRWTATSVTWTIVALTSALPFLATLARALPLSSFVQACKAAATELALSAGLAFTSATALVALAFAMASLRRDGSRGTRLFVLAVLPFLVSGPLLGIGLIRLFNRDGLGFVYDTVVVMVLACVARYLFLGYEALRTALCELDPRIEEAAAVAGVPWWRRMLGLRAPLTAPWILAAWTLAFLVCMREIDAVVLVYPPGAATLPVRLYGLMHYGPSPVVAALSLLIVLTLLVLAFVAAVAVKGVRDRAAARA